MSDSHYFGFERSVETTVSLHREENDDGTVTVSMVVSEYDGATDQTRRMTVRMAEDAACELGAALIEMGDREDTE